MLTITRDPDWRMAFLFFVLLGPILGVVVFFTLAGSIMSGLLTLNIGLRLGPLSLIFVYVAGALPALAAMAGFLFARRYANLLWYLLLSAGGGAACEALIKFDAHWLDVATPAVTAGLCTLITLAVSPKLPLTPVDPDATDYGNV